MRAEYTKELTNLREQMNNLQGSQNYEYTEVRYFDTMATLDSETKQAVAMRIQDIKK